MTSLGPPSCRDQVCCQGAEWHLRDLPWDLLAMGGTLQCDLAWPNQGWTSPARDLHLSKFSRSSSRQSRIETTSKMMGGGLGKVGEMWPGGTQGVGDSCQRGCCF